ncbi:MAG: LPS export ABC transporter periplasmic protein LptC [Sphingomonadaceae bacterium]|nr:LPS export ABC transporter periplasmic protein LptC [Sphingomonadaceae bacterium]
MSELALRDRDLRRVWAQPGSAHDRLVRLLGVVLPVAIGALAAILVIAPLTMRNEISFVLAKDKVQVAKERMRATEALYRGEDAQGRSFSLRAGSAVQKTSRIPVVELSDLSARIALDDGPALLRTPAASYDMDKQTVRVAGPLLFEAADGYRLETRGVGASLKTKMLAGDNHIDGRMPLGTFSSDRLRADLNARTVTLDGRARLHIVQGAARGR